MVVSGGGVKVLSVAVTSAVLVTASRVICDLYDNYVYSIGKWERRKENHQSTQHPLQDQRLSRCCNTHLQSPAESLPAFKAELFIGAWIPSDHLLGLVKALTSSLYQPPVLDSGLYLLLFFLQQPSRPLTIKLVHLNRSTRNSDIDNSKA
ncbi:hypothetical protein BJ508DRAFT_3751 [Ascobolus immersus RN42]|uniref:BCS1 N-terminal domain-containing protein n=1 Tax=Ascobolus immersus RN42 TaxID=1160509 RepID=A0A3N4IV94_ASCIM|nr:hypothetical protein BJ508DRAFT_3751 [Ascobolus immersus RN42]